MIVLAMSNQPRARLLRIPLPALERFRERGGKERDETLEIRSLNNARAARGRKGKAADLGFKPNRVTRVE